MDRKYKCIVIDPPWDQGKTGKRKARPNQDVKLGYETMTYEQIAELPINDWGEENSFLWIWATNSKSRSSGKPILLQAFDLLTHWGYEYYTMVTWDKSTGPCPFGAYQITTEHLIFGYKGKCTFIKESLGKMKTCFQAPVTRHSEKPVLFYENIDRYFEGDKLDVFARRRHKGFDAWGDQVEDEKVVDVGEGDGESGGGVGDGVFDDE